MFNVNALRQQFPALTYRRGGQLPVYCDGAAGTQVPHQCIDAMTHYLSACNANTGGVFASSLESDELLRQAHAGMAEFLNASAPEEIIFGPNMTTLTFQLSRALARTWRPGDEVVVTRLDHDANIRPWVLAARDAGASIRWVDIHPEDCILDMEDLKSKINETTRLVAVTAASNLVGTKVEVPTVVQLAHEVGALAFVDAVHFAPHGLIDVQAWQCDFLACSAYKFFGPHVGVLWGRRDLLMELTPYKLRPATEELPGRWMTGTQNHEGLAGLTGTLAYLGELSRNEPGNQGQDFGEGGRRKRLRSAMAAIQGHEQELARQFLTGLASLPGFKVWGITSVKEIDRRVPTFAITHQRKTSLELAKILAENQIFAWAGNMYAIELTDRLGVEDKGGMLRISLVHYNTVEEVEKILKVMERV